MVLREKMNPLGLQAARFVVAEDDGGGCQGRWLSGVGQLKPLPGGDSELLELASLVVAPQCRGQGVGRWGHFSNLFSNLLAQKPSRRLSGAWVGEHAAPSCESCCPRQPLRRRCGC
jgi:N-acetylglutamate synthase-like GNAT family acetyltransferase